MQTTLDIDDDVLAAAEHLAEERKQTVGAVISSLSRQSLPKKEFAFERRDGIPVLPHSGNSRPVTFEMVQAIRDEMGE